MPSGAAANVGRGIVKAEPNKAAAPALPREPQRMAGFKPCRGHSRGPGAGCIGELAPV